MIVSHITNTPWNENYAYVHDCRGLHQSMKSFDFKKNFHVSPFMPMNIKYEWIFSEPGEKILVSMNNIHKQEFIFKCIAAASQKGFS